MNNQVQLLFLIAFALFTMQAVGGWFQIRDYRKAIHRVHKLGNVGIGQKKGGFLTGYLVLIACDAEGMITGAEVMDGMTFLAKFHPCRSVLGKELHHVHIEEFLKEFQALDQRKRKYYKGYIQALEALKMRLEQQTVPEDTDAVTE